MQSAMYSGLFGALTSEHRMNSIANNLANVNTTGYKRDQLAFADTFQMYAHDMIFEAGANIRDKKMFPEPTHFARPRIAVALTDFQQGALKGTSSPLDVAIGGDGFFRVQTPDGEFLTRNGHFRTTAEGLLITEQGFRVLGEGGEITVPAGYRDLVIAEDGRMYADGLQFGQLAVVGVANPEALEKKGHNLYAARNGAEIEEAEVDRTATRVMQGFLEAPNVDAVYEMVNMIETQRHFEAMQKVMQSSDTIDREAITKVGKRV